MFSPLPVCRPALPSDRADVLEFTKFIWDGHDYIKYVWEDWLADPRGLLAVVEYAGHAIALGKVTYAAEGQWWLEGLRVDPRHQGLKLGTRIFEYLDHWWQQNAGGCIRLMTAWDRVQVHHLCERFGWRKIGEVKAWEAPATQGDHSFVPVPESDVPEALRFAFAHLDYCWQLADVGWVFAMPDEPMLVDQARRGRLYRSLTPDFRSLSENDAASRSPERLRKSPAIVGFWDEWDEGDGERALGISFLACSPDSLTATLPDLRRLAGALGYASIRWHAPFRGDAEAALIATGFESMLPGSAFLFGKDG